jgi:hypothetical protein
MVPKVELIYSFDYAQRLYKGEPEKFNDAWQDLINNGGIFEAVFEQAIDPVLANIPKVTGYDWVWEKGFLPVYLVIDGETFPNPLTLVATSDPEQMLYDLIHMLVRVNVNIGFTNDQIRDQILQKVAKQVIFLAKIDLTDAIAEARLGLVEKYGPDYQPSDLDLTQKNLKYYLERK